ncbi:NADP-dependent malic enzyme [Candidatus Nucleicultrix amoebiphila]|uniref:Malic enzyme n=1 Tax=Candidatus Nucleicultrix amoebiphila FS5 TaxID=1414854 RepID=A0A1W6N4W4_9PROT|nr:NADP-dependent malic enzyme [Candidatus Nucleicultrix amoebiphila]ARN84819.1 malic enzyme [Candidatus Nucleicultrix amoebiphila FS5]
MKDEFYKSALDYHRYPKPGKLAIVATKPLANQRDLSLAYSPGVAAACHEIIADPKKVSELTGRQNLVGVITNGTAVLGLGNAGPLAAKPVMEGKAVLFKKFAGIDVFDIEINEQDPDKLVDIIASLEPTFGALNLEDIKAPECFYVEKKLRERLKIPVFHDDQHGTAIIVSAAILNSLELVGKNISKVKLVTSGAGAAAIACLNLLLKLGLKREHVFVTDIDGVIHKSRKDLDDCQMFFAQDTQARCLEEVMEGADIFLGLSAGGVLKPEFLKNMADKPIILALANPNPEIVPDAAKAVRPDAIVATGRSDFPNQVNNVLCFPFIFRGALDVGATRINDEMKLACVHALANLAKVELSDIVLAAYGSGEDLRFGPEYIIPRPFDPRLMSEIAPAVAEAAMKTKVAERPLSDLAVYKQQMSEFVFRTGMALRPIFNQARKKLQRIVFSEGEDTRVLRAAQIALDEKLIKPILVGRPKVIEFRLERLGLRMCPGVDFELIDPQKDHRFNIYWQAYHKLMERRGVSPDFAKTILRTNSTVIAALMVHLGDADAMLCGPEGRYQRHLEHIQQIIGLKQGGGVIAAISGIVLDRGVYFICDSYVNKDPTADELAEITLMAAQQVRQFGLIPKVALLSHSSFGSSTADSAEKMRQALIKISDLDQDLEIEGEMHADAAFDPEGRNRIFPHSRLKGQANLLIMPNLDAANIAFNMLKGLANAQPIGPVLLGGNKSAHILTPSVSVRGVLNMTVLAAVNT